MTAMKLALGVIRSRSACKRVAGPVAKLWLGLLVAAFVLVPQAAAQGCAL